MFRYQALAPLFGAALFALPLSAMPQTDRWHGDWKHHHERADWKRHHHDWNDHHRRGARPEKRLVEKYDTFAGSDANATSLVSGLRNDTRVELSRGGSSTTFNPPTDKMGYGNVDISLALAKASLADHGIRRPTPDQIKAVLVGGTVTDGSGARVTLPGVLNLRASGMGWGEIVHKHGFKLDEVMHPHKDRKHHHKHADWKDHHKHGDWKHHHKHADWKHQHRYADWKHHDFRPKHHDRADFHRARFERPDFKRPDKVKRPEKWERPHRPERPEKHEHRR